MFDKHIPELKRIRSLLHKLALSNEAEIYQTSLRNACAISAYLTYLYFRKNKYKPIVKISKTSGSGFHCWIEVEKHVIDLTATQFDIKEEILILPIRRKKDFDVFRMSRSLHNLREIRKEFSTWTEFQDPFWLLENSKTMKQIHKEIV